MRVSIDRQLCEGHGKCEEATPAIFEVGDDDISTVKLGADLASHRAAVERAARLCPRQAIRLEDADA